MEAARACFNKLFYCFVLTLRRYYVMDTKLVTCLVIWGINMEERVLDFLDIGKLL